MFNYGLGKDKTMVKMFLCVFRGKREKPLLDLFDFSKYIFYIVTAYIQCIVFYIVNNCLFIFEHYIVHYTYNI